VTATFSLLMPCFNPQLNFLQECISSVLSQSFADWELCIIDDGSDVSFAHAFKDTIEKDNRIKFLRLEENSGIAHASNAGLAIARGKFILPIDQDDLLSEDALLKVLNFIRQRPQLKFGYSDSDRVTPDGEHYQVFRKPDWNYELFLAQNFCNHLTFIDSSLMRSIGGWRANYEGSQDYDLYLRVIELVDESEIGHIPEVIYHWRSHGQSVSGKNLATAVSAGRRAVSDHLERRCIHAEVEPAKGSLVYSRIRWKTLGDPLSVTFVSIGNASKFLKSLLHTDVVKERTLHCELIETDGSLENIATALHDSQQYAMVVLVHGSIDSIEPDDLISLIIRGSHLGIGCVAPKYVNSTTGKVFIPEEIKNRACIPCRKTERCLDANTKGRFAHLSLHQNSKYLCSDFLIFKARDLKKYGLVNAPEETTVEFLNTFCHKLSTAGLKNIWDGSVVASFVHTLECRDHTPVIPR